MYHSAYDLGSLMSALETVNGAVDEKYPELSRAFSEICGTHDDYIWQQATGSRGADVTVERGQVGFSAYHNCDMSHETRADEMMESVFGPIYDRQVANGNLISWGWMQHVVGGKWRRISTMTAADETRLMAARTAIIEEIGDGLEEEGKEFNSICGSHQDFIWNIVHEKP
jgi:hypothetical protein